MKDSIALHSLQRTTAKEMMMSHLAEPLCRHDNPMVGDAMRFLDREERDAERNAVFRAALRAEMLGALRGDFLAEIPCPGSFGGKARPAIDVVFGDATDAHQVAMLQIVREGAAGADVKLLCRALMSMLADAHAEVYCDAALLAEEESL